MNSINTSELLCSRPDRQMSIHEDSGGGNGGANSSQFSFDGSLPLLDFNTQDMEHDSEHRRSTAINSTLRSNGCKKTILIKPEDINLLKNPFEINKAVQDSIPDKSIIKDVRTNRRLNLIAIEFKENEPTIIDNLIASKKFGKWTATLRRPTTDTFKYGVISPVSVDMDTDLIREHIRINGQHQNIVKSVERMKKRCDTGWTDSNSIKISFSVDSLPNGISIFHSYYKIRPYVSEPLQCFKCQRFGHKADSCKGKQRCLLCGGEHSNKQCNLERNSEEDFTCANCKGAHKANSRKCPLFSNARKIEEVRAKENKTYIEAKTKVLSHVSQKDFPPLNRHTINAEVHQPMSFSPIRSEPLHPNLQQGQSHILKNSTWGSRKSTPIVISSSDSSTQTDNKYEPDLNFLGKLKECLCQLFDSSIFMESKNVRHLLIENALQKSFTQYKTSNVDNNNNSNLQNKRVLSDEEIDFWDASDRQDSEDEEGVISQDEMEDQSQGMSLRSQKIKPTKVYNKKKKLEESLPDISFNNDRSKQ